MTLVKIIDKYVGTFLCFFLFPLKILTKRKEKNLLIVKMWGMGDAILILPTLVELKKNFNGKITALVTSETFPVFKGYVDEIIVFDSKLDVKLPLRILEVIKKLISSKIGIVLDFEQFARISSIFSLFTFAEIRVGYSSLPGKSLLYTHKVFLDDKKHAAESFADIARAVGFKIEIKENVSIYIDEKDEKRVEEFLRENNLRGKKIIGIHPGSGNTAIFRRWDKEKFAEVANYFLNKGYEVVICGTEEEKEIIEFILKETQFRAKTSLGLNINEFAALCKYFCVFLANDSGAMHLASSVGTKTLGLFGPNLPERYAPFGKKNRFIYHRVECSPCINVHLGIVPNKCIRNDVKCMKLINTKEVIKAMEEMLSDKDEC